MAFVFDSAKMESNDLFHYNEWIETDGTGGWASSTLSGANSRRYHGMLVASLNPPLDRMVLLSKLDETIIIKEKDGFVKDDSAKNDIHKDDWGKDDSANDSNGTDFKVKRFELGFNAYGDRYDLSKPLYLKVFSKDLFPQWEFEVSGIKLKKTVCALHLQHTILVQYQVLEAENEFELELLPLIAGRGYHSLMHENSRINKTASLTDSTFTYQAYEEETLFHIGIEQANFEPKPLWYYNFYYKAEQERGQDFNEDLFSPGLLTIKLKAGSTVWLMISTEIPNLKNASQLFAAEKQRRLMLLKDLAVDEFSIDMILASDQFIVRKNEGENSVIAGYHWFSDWGRDTMISLTGLCLVTKRFAEAKGILRNFASHLNKGIIPNRFLDNDIAPEYNTVDATLWFFIACYRYGQYSGDEEFLVNEMLPVFTEIIKWHKKGTWYNIHVDGDGLLWAGEDNVQLTWMDAKVDDWVVTPRTGKAVEVNALWYNALRIFSGYLGRDRRFEESAYFEAEADKVRLQFKEQFWNKEGQYLYDYINGDHRDEAFRPNQLFAISLPFPLLEADEANQVLNQIEQKLYTPKGLRSLAPGSEGYQPYYYGDRVQRDGAYHQGTVWSWLLGPYIDALISFRGDDGRKQARAAIFNFMPHLNEAGIGSVSEIFDATAPYYPKGCIAQAWGVAEVLRVYMQYKLYR